MDDPSTETKRLTLPITPETYERMNKQVPRGLRRYLIGAVLKAVLDWIEEGGDPYTIIGALESGRYRLKVVQPKEQS